MNTLSIKTTLLSTLAAATMAGVSIAPAQAASTVFESRDILTPTQALGRFDWLNTCYQGLLVEVHDQMFDATAPMSSAQKVAALKNAMLYDNGNLRSDAKYLTFGNSDNENPKAWFAGTSSPSNPSSCPQIPSDYGVSAVMVSPTTPTYCATKARDKQWEYIKKVSLSDMTNSSEAAFYSNFVGQAAKVYQGNSYVISLTPGFTSAEAFPEYWHVYIDWNQDGDFTDASETHLIGSSDTTMTKSLTVPSSAVKGLTKMRVSMDYFGGNASACAEINSGEIEDYLIYIK